MVPTKWKYILKRGQEALPVPVPNDTPAIGGGNEEERVAAAAAAGGDAAAAAGGGGGGGGE